tara:strand:+ start:504 stop:1139 length:636 start_codon:yes stop_codon:yes gene_type:complete
MAKHDLFTGSIADDYGFNMSTFRVMETPALSVVVVSRYDSKDKYTTKEVSKLKNPLLPSRQFVKDLFRHIHKFTTDPTSSDIITIRNSKNETTGQDYAAKVFTDAGYKFIVDSFCQGSKSLTELDLPARCATMENNRDYWNRCLHNIAGKYGFWRAYGNNLSSEMDTVYKNDWLNQILLQVNSMWSYSNNTIVEVSPEELADRDKQLELLF